MIEDGGAEGLTATGVGGQATISLTLDALATHVCIFEISQLEDLYVGNLYIIYNTSS